MKKIAISLIALAAVSTVAMASNRNNDLRDSDTYTGKYAQAETVNATTVDAFAVKKVKNGSGLTLQELIVRSQDERNVH